MTDIFDSVDVDMRTVYQSIAQTLIVNLQRAPDEVWETEESLLNAQEISCGNYLFIYFCFDCISFLSQEFSVLSPGGCLFFLHSSVLQTSVKILPLCVFPEDSMNPKMKRAQALMGKQCEDAP